MSTPNRETEAAAARMTRLAARLHRLADELADEVRTIERDRRLADNPAAVATASSAAQRIQALAAMLVKELDTRR